MYLAHYTKRFIPEFDAECRIKANKALTLQGLLALSFTFLGTE